MPNSLVQDTELDLLVVNEASSQVDIVPSLTSGTKIADFYINSEHGELFAPQQNSYVAGTDLKIENNTISVDTNGVTTGDYNFVAGYNTSAQGDYNFVAGYNCAANGIRNAAFCANNKVFDYSNFAAGISNSVSGSSNFVGGQNNIVQGTANTVFGIGNNIIDDSNNCNTIIGQYAVSGDYYFAVGNGVQNSRSNVFEIRKNNEIYFNYNGEMIRLAPPNRIVQHQANILKDGTTSTILSVNNTDKFVIEGKYDTDNSRYEIICRNTNTVNRYLYVFTPNAERVSVGPAQSSTIITLSNSDRVRFQIFGMGVGASIPRAEYEIYTMAYTNRLYVVLYEISKYGI